MKLDIGTKQGKTFHTELEKEKQFALHGKKIGDEIEGTRLDSKLKGYKFIITGLSDSSGFPARKDLEGTARKKLLLTKGIGMKGKGGKMKKKRKLKGLRLRKSIRGNTIARDIEQVNLKAVEQGPAKLEEIFKPAEKQEKPEPKPEPKTEPKPKPEPEAKPKPEPKPEAKPEAQPEEKKQ